MPYTKLFAEIVTSSIWTEDSDVCKVWITMLAIADKHGEVHASVPGLAQIAGLSLPLVEDAIAKFMSPDKYSRTPDDEGRRIEEIDGGWLLLNHAKYRAMASREEEKSAAAKRQAAFRERQKRNGRVTDSNENVTPSNAPVTPNVHIAEAEAEAEAKEDHSLSPKGTKKPKRFTKPTPQEVTAYAKTIGFDLDGNRFCDHYEAKGWLVGKSPMKSWQASVRTWKGNHAEAAKPKEKSLIGIPL